MTDRETLLPCPFCGGAGDIESQPSYSQAANTYNRYRGWCDGCGFGLDWHSYEDEARTGWNTRATTADAVAGVAIPACQRCGGPSPQGIRCHKCLAGEVEQLRFEADRNAAQADAGGWIVASQTSAPADMVERLREAALRDIAEAEPIPNDADAAGGV